MTSVAVVTTALASALAAAASSVLQHRSAQRAPHHRARTALGLLRHLLHQPVWVVGVAAAAVGLVLHVIALRGGRLTLVQPLLVSGLLFALPVSVLLERRRPSLVEWLWGLAVIAGLSLFLLSARPRGGAAAAPAAALAVACGLGVAVMLLLLATSRESSRHKPLLLAAAGGIGFGVTSALMKQCAADASGGVVSLLSAPSLYALVAVGALSIVVTQVAYRAGPLAASLPAMTIGDPAAAVLIGVFAFHETLNRGPGSIAVELVGFVLMGFGTRELARRSAARAAAR
jgi:drug/metabolite transporter (DMT)-like permease